MYHFSLKRPHLDNELTKGDSFPQQSTTFTNLLNAAEAEHTSISTYEYDNKRETTPGPTSSLILRRLRNRESCRKTRLKRKLQQHALGVLVHERQDRNEYLERLACKLDVGSDNKISSGGNLIAHGSLFRDLASRSLHYALVDPEYSGWPDDGSSLTALNVSTIAEINRKREEQTHATTRRSKRLRLSRDTDPTKVHGASLTPQVLLFKQWRLVVDGLQNVVLKLRQPNERDLGDGAFEQYCHWRLVGVSSMKFQRDGDIVAVAVTGTTVVRFHGCQVEDVSINVVRRELNTRFEFNADGDIKN
ncbi:unnamed protein product [Phytophthora fragariaefolia]|uniref:Unnamed protein product n=1 Tax=Phytophthora fragariaefolia TaxID=1490495 RepID=A0A9W6XKG3_9STRA|nr:unnamed protein product [Phytophthora fragariaefolia]